MENNSFNLSIRESKMYFHCGPLDYGLLWKIVYTIFLCMTNIDKIFICSMPFISCLDFLGLKLFPLESLNNRQKWAYVGMKENILWYTFSVFWIIYLGFKLRYRALWPIKKCSYADCMW